MYTYRCTLDRVVDGDTVDLWIDLGFRLRTHQRIRMLGYDAPEVRGPTRAAGLEATEKLRSLLAGKSLRIRTEKSEKYGRWLGVVFAGRVNVNRAMGGSG